jgi:capsular polysaccharide transport system permease protein
MKILLKLFATVFFIAGAIYIIKIETERYQSVTTIKIKDLSKQQSISAFDMILSQVSPTMQDSKLMEIYIRSNEMFSYLDKDFNLTAYYSGEQIDPLRRLKKDSFLTSFALSRGNLIKQYNEDLFIIYDPASTTLKIGFAHADPKIAQSIVENIIKYSSKALNTFEKENANVALQFLKKQVVENETKFTSSIKKMINYQNINNTIDPNLDVQSKSTMLAQLESDLVQKTVQFKSSSRYMIKNSSKMKIAINEIKNLKKEIYRIKKEIAGKGGEKTELNQAVFDFELLKNDIDFKKEIYKQSLTKLEELKAQVSQNIKNLLVVDKPSLPELYTFPNKPKNLLTLFIIVSFLYGIIASIITLLKDHQD